MIKCETCGREFKTTQALGGHMRFVHGIKKDGRVPLLPPKRFITDKELEEALSVMTKLIISNTKDVAELQKGLACLVAVQPESSQEHWKVLVDVPLEKHRGSTE